MKKIASFLTLIALILGSIFGFLFKEISLNIEFLGTIYITLLKYLILPIIFTSISTSIYNSRKDNNKLIIKTIIIFTTMFISSFLLSSLIIWIIDPAKNFNIIDNNNEVTTLNIKLINLFENIIPKNITDIFVGKNLFFIILLSFIFGYLCNIFKGEKLINYIIKFRDLLYKLLNYINYYTPIAVFSLMAATVSKYGSDVLKAGGSYILSAYISGIIIAIMIMIIPLYFIVKIKPIDYIKKVYSIWLITLSTCSSAATLPYTIKLCKEELKLDHKITDVVIPLGSTIHMCGGAVSFSLLALFCSKLYGINITFELYLTMLIGAVLINMGAPGIPGGGVVIGATYLQMFGIPLSFIGLYSGIYKILDMLYTSLNVTGDISANIIINKIN